MVELGARCAERQSRRGGGLLQGHMDDDGVGAVRRGGDGAAEPQVRSGARHAPDPERRDSNPARARKQRHEEGHGGTGDEAAAALAPGHATERQGRGERDEGATLLLGAEDDGCRRGVSLLSLAKQGRRRGSRERALRAREREAQVGTTEQGGDRPGDGDRASPGGAGGKTRERSGEREAGPRFRRSGLGSRPGCGMGRRWLS